MTGKESTVVSFKATEIWLRRLEASFSPRRPRFNARKFHVGLVGNVLYGLVTERHEDMTVLEISPPPFGGVRALLWARC